MRHGRNGARTRTASGRFARAWVVATVGVAACQTVGGPGPSTPDAETLGPRPVVVAPGPITEADQAAAAELLASARTSAQARRFFEVIRTTDELLERFPASESSGEALWLSAQASFETGELTEADEKAGRYADLLPAGDERSAEVHLFRAATLPDSLPGQLERLLRIGTEAAPGTLVQAGERVRDLSNALRPDELEPVVSAAGAGPLRSIAEARLAVTLLEYGRIEDAERFAQGALDGGVVGTDRDWAEGVLSGELPEGRGRETDFRIGVILPLGGPPGLAEFATLVAEGIEVAAATVLGDDYSVELLVRDDQGDPSLTSALVAELDSAGVHGIVGLLQDDDLLNAAEARSRPIPLISPTARSADRAGGYAYSLEGADRQAAASVAAYAVSRAFQRIAIILPQTPEAEAEALAFEQTATRLGMEIVGRFAYEAGATFFEPQIGAARDALRSRELASLNLSDDDTLHVELLEPTAIFMPIPAEDVEFLVPQAIHFGLDTLAIELLGTTGWTDPGVLQAVDDRLTTGIVATAAVGRAEGTPAGIAFRDAYEEYFQRSLVGPTASVGYDAALLLLEALRPGRIAPEQLAASFEALESVEGATGLYSVDLGRVYRSTQVVRIEDRVPVPIVPDTLTQADSAAVPDTIGLPEIRR